MQQTLQQLGQLLLGSIPTILLFVALYFSLKKVLYKPLQAVLNERAGLIEGKLETARTTVESANLKLANYQDALQQKRADGYRTIEARRKDAQAAGQALLEAAHKQSQQTLVAARQQIADESARGQQQLKTTAASLAADVLRHVLPQTNHYPGVGA